MRLPDFPKLAIVNSPCPQRLARALAALQEAAEAAHQGGYEAWQFAIGLEEFFSLGLNGTDLRWLIAQGFAEHAIEKTKLESLGRSFRKARNLRLTRRSSFVLTEAGARLFQEGGDILDLANPTPLTPNPDAESALPTDRPCWDSSVRVLRYLGLVIKRFAVPAPSQETILEAFQEEGWPARISDPLPRRSDQDPEQRLHDAVRGLNRRQSQRLLRFQRDGTGEGICWAACLPG